MTETYDQIGVFSFDERVGKYMETTESGHGPETNWSADGYPDYGVFNFSELFSFALNDKPLNELTKRQKSTFVDRFEHKVSDHMPIWFRIPLPKTGTGFPA